MASERSRLEDMGVCGSSQPDTVEEPVPTTNPQDESTSTRSVATSTIGPLQNVGDGGRERMAPLMSSKVGAASGSFTPTTKKKVKVVVGVSRGLERWNPSFLLLMTEEYEEPTPGEGTRPCNEQARHALRIPHAQPSSIGTTRAHVEQARLVYTPPNASHIPQTNPRLLPTPPTSSYTHTTHRWASPTSSAWRNAPGVGRRSACGTSWTLISSC